MKDVLHTLFSVIALASLLATIPLSAQISEGGRPPSFAYDTELRSAAAPLEVKVDFRIADLLEADKKRENGVTPPRVAQIIPVDYSIDDAGYRTTLPSGEQILRLRLHADSAVAILLYYADFYIPPGGKLFIYGADKKQVLGAYTNRTRPSGGLFATEFVGGDDLTLEYVESTTSDERPRIRIDGVGYGYDKNALRSVIPDAPAVETRDYSGDCMVNVNCEEGEAWRNEKKGVCHTIQRVGNYGMMCSASLMNNTAEDFKPLILTARHCGCLDTDDEYASEYDFQRWVFYFHEEMENCSNNSRRVDSKTMTGCRLRAFTRMDGQSDGMLLELLDMIPDDYDVYYNGWDHSDIPAESGVGIHHPSGDVKKISTFTDMAVNGHFDGSDISCEENAHWNIHYIATTNGHSITKGGSSGSPLFNENKLIVGTLTGGVVIIDEEGNRIDMCTKPDENSEYYGKLSYHWNRYRRSESTGMDEWLDPLRLGVETLRGRYRNQPVESPPLNLRLENLANRGVYLTWDAPAGYDAPVLYNVYRNNRKIGVETGLSYLDTEPSGSYSVYAVTAVYAGYRESESVQVSMRSGAEHVETTAVGVFPTTFSNQIYLKGYERIASVETITISGQVCLEARRPAETLDTSTLPAGFYFFRIHADDGRTTTVKAMKK